LGEQHLTIMYLVVDREIFDAVLYPEHYFLQWEILLKTDMQLHTFDLATKHYNTDWQSAISAERRSKN
jgi:hypothetical protein